MAATAASASILAGTCRIKNKCFLENYRQFSHLQGANKNAQTNNESFTYTAPINLHKN